MTGDVAARDRGPRATPSAATEVGAARPLDGDPGHRRRTRARLLRAATAAFVLLAAVALVMTLWWPLGFDQAIFAVNGSVILRGGQPYRDAYELRGPLAFYLFAGIEWLFGRRAAGVRIADALFTLATAAMVGLLVRRFASARAAVLTGAAFVLVVVSQSANDTAQPDLWVGTAVLGAVMLAARAGGPDRWTLLACGALLALPSLLKPFYPAYLAIPGLAILLRRQRDVRGIAGDLAWLLVGWALPLALTAWWLAHVGVFDDFVDAHLLYSLRLYVPAAGAGEARIRGVVVHLLQGPIIGVALPAVVLGAHTLWPRARALALALGTAVLVTIACVALQGHFFPYHWAPLLAPCSVLAGVGLGTLLGGVGAVRDARARALAAAVAAAVLAAVAFRPLLDLVQWGALAAGRTTSDAYHARFGLQWSVNPADQRAVAAYLRARTRPGDAIGMWGSDAAVAFLADRPLATRFPLSRYFELSPENPVTQAFRRELLTALERRRPRYFLVNRHVPAFQAAPPPLAQQFPALDSLVRARYEPDTTIGSIEVLRARQPR